MISTDLQRVQIQSIVENQLPSFVQDDFPLLGEFLKEYYVSQEYPGASADLLQNIDEYLKLNSLTDNADQTELGSDISYTDTTIIDLPEYWTELVDENSITVSITPKDFAQPNLFVSKVTDNKVYLESDGEISAYYIINGTRKDIRSLEVEI